MKDNDQGVLKSQAVDINLNHWVNIFWFEIDIFKFLILVKPDSHWWPALLFESLLN